MGSQYMDGGIFGLLTVSLSPPDSVWEAKRVLHTFEVLDKKIEKTGNTTSNPLAAIICVTRFRRGGSGQVTVSNIVNWSGNGGDVKEFTQ